MLSNLKPSHTLALASLVALAACGARPAPGPDSKPESVLAALADADSLELIALHPTTWQLDPELESAERFHEYPILGRTALKDAAEANALLALIERGIEESDGTVAACFNPRHGLSIVHGASTTDFVICFECFSMFVYEDGVRVASHLTTATHEPAVTALFESRGLTIQKES